MKRRLLVLFIFLLFAQNVLAHCPLCTIGAGITATGAAYLGVKNIIIGVFIGAFAIALGLWISKLIKKDYIKHQKSIITLLSFVFTVFPVMPMMKDYSSIYISFFGNYGSLFNKTYLINLFLIGSFIGAVIMLISSSLSKIITKIRNNKRLPYQGIILTFILLILVSIILQVRL